MGVQVPADPAATLAEAEAGTEPSLRRFSPERVKQAIDALAGNASLGQIPLGFTWSDGDGGSGDGEMGPPGIQGPAGTAGTAGATGPRGPIGFALDGEEGEVGPSIPGIPGPTGNAGATGPRGPIGIGLDADEPELPMAIPGVPGPSGGTGATGPRGPIGLGLDGFDGDDGMPIPGPMGPPGSDGVGGEAWTTITKVSDEDRTADTNLSDDAELGFTPANGTVYIFEAALIYASPAGAGIPDIKVQILEGGTSSRGSFLYVCLGTTLSAVAAGATCGATITAGTQSFKTLILIRGWFTGAGGGSGDFVIRWAQNTSNANPTTVYAGSYLRYKTIP